MLYVICICMRRYFSIYKDTHCFLTFEQWPWRRCRAIETSHGRWEVDAAMSIVSHHRSVFLLWNWLVFVWETYRIWWKSWKMKGNQETNNFYRRFVDPVPKNEEWMSHPPEYQPVLRCSRRRSQCSWIFVYVGGGPQWCSQLWEFVCLTWT